MMSQLDFRAFEAVVARLKKEYAKAEAAKARGDEDDFGSFRTCSVKQFEMAYELGIKTMRHYFELVSPLPDELDGLNYRNFIRLMSEVGLDVDPDQWGAFRQERNKAVHTYFEPVADSIYQRMPEYLAAFDLLLISLRKQCI